ncbi:MAG TPA: FixH family protein [Ktedonobacterales bacterium]|jgi:hypothetical protein
MRLDQQPLPSETPAHAEPPARDEAKLRQVRRRALLVVGAVLVVLFFAGVGELASSFIPHTTPAFANGRTQQAGDLAITLQFSPNPPKVSTTPTTQVGISVQTKDGQALTGAQVEVSLVMLTMDMGTNDTIAQEIPNGSGSAGQYQARIAFLMPGAWQVTIRVAPPGGPPVSSTFAVDVAN